MLLAKVARRKVNENLLFSFYLAQQKEKNLLSKREMFWVTASYVIWSQYVTKT